MCLIEINRSAIKLKKLHFCHIFLFFTFQDTVTDLKLVIEDTIDNVATLQDCSGDQGQSVQLLGENTHW